MLLHLHFCWLHTEIIISDIATIKQRVYIAQSDTEPQHESNLN